MFLSRKGFFPSATDFHRYGAARARFLAMFCARDLVAPNGLGEVGRANWFRSVTGSIERLAAG